MVNSTLIFIASIAGIFAYFIDNSAYIFIGFATLLIISIAVTVAARSMTKHYPVPATWMFLAWQIVPLTFVFLGAFTSAWLSLNIMDFLPITFSDDPTFADAIIAEKTTIKSLTITAITTLLAAVVLDAARDPSSEFWPSEQHKRSLKSAYHASPIFDLKADQISKEVKHAIQDLRAAYIGPSTTDNKAHGWSFDDRLHRAKVIRAALDIFKKHSVEF